MAKTRILLDTGPLVAVLVKDDQWNEWATARWDALTEPVYTCEAVLSEAVFRLQSAGLGTAPLAQLFTLGIVRLDFDLEPHRRDVFALLQKYQDAPMDLADACLVKMAELAADVKVFTTDKHFVHYRRRQRNVIPQISPHV